MPHPAMSVNQTAVIGAKTVVIFAVPKRWMAKSTTKKAYNLQKRLNPLLIDEGDSENTYNRDRDDMLRHRWFRHSDTTDRAGYRHRYINVYLRRVLKCRVLWTHTWGEDTIREGKGGTEKTPKVKWPLEAI
jgi:hypothetical protein